MKHSRATHRHRKTNRRKKRLDFLLPKYRRYFHWALYFTLVISFISLSLITLSTRISRDNRATDTAPQETFLRGEYDIGVVSMNNDQACTNSARGDTCPSGTLTLKEGIRQSIAEGKKWDIVGFQEILDPEQKPHRSSETQEFINIMAELSPGSTYSCIKQSIYSEDFYTAICSAYPLLKAHGESFRSTKILQLSNVA